MRRALALATCALATACGERADERERARGPALEGLYELTAAPSSQPCGEAMVTFTTQAAYFVVVSEDGEDEAAVIFGETILDATAVTLEESGHFEAAWTAEWSDPVSCPSSGRTHVVTTFTNLWVGDGDLLGFESLLHQQMDTDCEPSSSCFMTWELTGAATGG